MPDVNTSSFVIPQAVQQKYADLVFMLQGSKSINDEEKQYWFTALETMDESQVGSLREILEDERKQLLEAQKEYNAKAEVAFQETEMELKEKQRKEAEAARKVAEAQNQQEEAQKEADLLAQLNNL